MYVKIGRLCVNFLQHGNWAPPIPSPFITQYKNDALKTKTVRNKTIIEFIIIYSDACLSLMVGSSIQKLLKVGVQSSVGLWIPAKVL